MQIWGGSDDSPATEKKAKKMMRTSMLVLNAANVGTGEGLSAHSVFVILIVLLFSRRVDCETSLLAFRCVGFSSLYEKSLFLPFRE